MQLFNGSPGRGPDRRADYRPIGTGFVILLGVGRGDSENDAKFLADRVVGLRVFADAAGKMNLALDAAHGDFLVISQFTLYADTSQRRPSFVNAAPPDEAERLYELFLSLLRARGVKVETGEFGARWTSTSSTTVQSR